MRAVTQNTLSFLGRLRLWQKLALLVAAMAVPAVLLGCFYFTQAAAGARQARGETEGARYLKALGSVSAEMLTHRGRAYAFLSGDKSRQADVVSQAAEVDNQVAAMDKVDTDLGEQFGVAPEWQAIKSEWAALKSKTLQQTADESETAHAALANHLALLAEEVGVRSMTSFDPDLATHALVRVASEWAPELMTYSSNMRRHAVRAASKGYLGGDDRMGIRVFRDRQLAAMGSLSASLERMTPESKSVLQPVADTAKSTADEFYAVLQSKVLNAANLETTGGAIYDAGVPTNRALKKLSAASYDALTAALDHRQSRLSQWRALTAGISALALALALTLSLFITRSLSKPLHQAVAVFDSMSAGSYDNQIDVDGTDEAGQVLHALDEMQGKLRSQIEAERTVAAENIRIRRALDKASTSVVLADATHEIIYLNHAAQTTFTRGESEIRKALPGFDAQRVQGSGLDYLSLDPAKERRTLDELTVPQVRERTRGALTFRTVTSPIMGDNGERLGTVSEWTDRTPEVAVEKEMQTMLSAVVAGDLTSRVAVEGKTAFFEAMSRSVNQLADNMAEIVALVKEAAGEVYRGSSEIASGNTNLQQRTEEQSASLEETAASMEQMTTTVKQNADNAGEANQLAVAARDQAEQGGTVVGKAVRAMSGINDSARKIADIIGVIDEIAFQTNLLALNAAVEAARAGEQGRGFAVVATEVRTLAGRSASAAKEIKELIQDSVKKVEDGSALVTRSGQTLEQIVASVKKVSDIVAEIAAASREQSLGIGQVNRAVLQMDELTQQNAALVEQATTASQSMAHEAHALHEMMGGYRLGDLVRTPNMSEAGVGSGARPAAASSTDVEPAPRAERRSAKRPWGRNASDTRVAKERVKAAVTGPEAAAPPETVATASADDDSEWQEF